jgi:GntR family transcriptional regulator, transcriptional repressor for pyruvate dehydrogenase complex
MSDDPLTPHVVGVTLGPDIRRQIHQGMEAHMGLPEELADRLLGEVAQGKFAVETLLPPEGELARAYGVSRLTVREAIRILRSKNVVEIHRGRGTFVNRPEAWTSLDAIVRLAVNGDSAAGVSERLLEARAIVEIGAARLAAVRRSDEDLAELDSCVQEMVAGADAGDVDLFVDADIAFHDVIMRASGNLFVPFMLEPFGQLLRHTREQTSAVPEIQRHAIEHHRAIRDSLASGDESRARQAMEAHMEQTRADLKRYVRTNIPNLS